MTLARSKSAPQHRQSLIFGQRALLARDGRPLPPPRSGAKERALEPQVVALLVLAPPVGLFVWWRRYRRTDSRGPLGPWG